MAENRREIGSFFSLPPEDDSIPRRYRTLLNTIGDGIYQLDANGNFVAVNDAIVETTGYTREELLGEHVSLVLDDPDVERVETVIRGLLSDGENESETLELYVRTATGETIPCELRIGVLSTDEEFQGTVGVARDVSDREERQKALDTIRGEHASIVDDVLDETDVAIFILDSEFRVGWINEATERFFGLDRDEVVGRDKRQLIEEEVRSIVDDPDRFAEILLATYDDNSYVEQFECHVTPVDGETRWLEHRSKPIESGGYACGRVELYYDVTERKRSERNLRERERELERRTEAAESELDEIFDRVSDAFYALDSEWRFTHVNERAEELLQRSEEELVGKCLWEEYPEAADTVAWERFHEAMETQEQTRYDLYFEPLEFWVEATVYPSESGVSVYFRDVTERKRREHELERYESTVETIWDGVATLDPDGRFVMVNEAFCELTGYDRTDLIGEHVTLVHDEDVDQTAIAMNEEVAAGDRSSATLEFDLVTADGDTIPVEGRFGPFEYGNGEIGRTGVVRDISERKERERELERYRTIVETSDDGVYVLDEEFNFVMVNDAYAEMTGYDREELLGTHCSLVVDEEVSSESARRIQEMADGDERSATLEADLIRKDGSRLRAESNFTSLPSEDADRPWKVGIVRDVSERVARERELEESRRRYQTLVENFPNGAVALVDQNLHYRTVGGSPLDVANVTIDELENRPVREVLPPELEDLIVPRYEAALEGESSTFEGESNDRIFQFQIVPVRDGDGEIFAALGMSQDITERREYQRRLEESEHRYRTLAENFPDGAVALFDDDMRYTAVGGQLLTQLGISSEEAVGMSIWERYPDDIVERIEPYFTAALDGEANSFEIEYHDRHLLAHTLPVGEPDDEIFTGMLVVQDITERKERERELEQYHAMTEAASDVIVTIDEDSTIRSVNPAVEDVFGYERDDLIGRSLTTLMSADYADRHRAGVERYLETGERALDWSYQELPGQREDGSEIPLGISFSEIEYNDEWFFTGIIRDVTERKEHERELERRAIQQRTLAELGQRALDADADELDDVMHEASQLVAETLGNAYCKVLDLDAEKRELLLRQGVGWQEGIVGSASIAADKNSQAGFTLLSEEPVVVDDLASETRFSGPELLTSHDVMSGISTIIGSFEEPWGILGTHDTARREFTDEDVDFVQSVANVLATTIDRVEYERQLEQQRERLAALDNLNGVVREITKAIIDRSTREEIERTVCEALFGSDSYDFAWVGEVDSTSRTMTVRAESGATAYLDDATISLDSDEGTGWESIERAIRTHELQVIQNGRVDPEHDSWHSLAEKHGYRSSATIPITHDDTLYGVLTVYTERPTAFEDEEGTVLEHFGEIMGHAIAAVERKRALMSDTVVELDFEVANLLGTLDIETESDATISFDQIIPLDDEEFVIYGTVTGDGMEVMREIAERMEAWEEISVINEDREATRFELRVSEPPLLSTVASLGAYIVSAVIENGDYHVTVQLPPNADVRQVIEAIQDSYPEAEALARRQVTRSDDPSERVVNTWLEGLTDRQRAVVETAYFSGFFEWPRDRSGEEVAQSLDISPATFSQHMRVAENKLFGALLDEMSAVR